MDPFIYIERKNISDVLCDAILSIEDEYIPLYPTESSPWFDITNILTENITSAVTVFIERNSLDIYRMHNIIQNSDFLQTNMVLHRQVDSNYHNDFKVIDKTHSTLSYMWSLGPTVEIVFGKSYKINIEKGDLVIFPASWEYPYKLDSSGIYLKGTLYTSYE
jgi:hypothetical protein